MATETLVGGVYNSLSDDTKALLDAVLADTGNGTVTQLTGGAVLVVGAGENGEAQGAVVAPSGVAVTGEVSLGGTLEVSVVIPAGISFSFEGPPAEVTPEAAQTYAVELANAAIPDGSSAEAIAVRESIIESINALVGSLVSQGATSVSFRVINFSSAGSGSGGAQAPNAAGDVVFTGTPGVNEVLAFVMGALNNGETLVLENVAASLLVGTGSARVGAGAAAVSGDSASQAITGGAGADTLVGGGGADTLVGGGGADLFGVNADVTLMTIGDLDITKDKLVFLVDGVNSIADLAPYFTGFTVSADAVTANFVGGRSITLVGVQVSDLTDAALQNFIRFDI